MNKSGIEWCDHTWNPITGCRHGCSYCYADKMSLRFCGNMKRNMVQTDQYRMEGDLFVLDEPFMNEDGNCMLCGKTEDKNKMVTLTARAVRGGKATSFGHMCHSCFAKWLTSHSIPVPDERLRKKMKVIKSDKNRNYNLPW